MPVLILALLIARPGIVLAASVGAKFERTLGVSAAPALIKEYGGQYTLPVQQRLWVEEVFARLVAQSGRDDVEYTLTVLNSREPNAFSLPGGFVFITRGLLDLIGHDQAQLAAVLGHEIAHVEKKHGVNAVIRQMGLTVLAEVGAVALDFVAGELLRMAGLTLVQVLQAGWGREAEYEADVLGQALAAQAGFDPVGAVSLLKSLAAADKSGEPMHMFRTHPDPVQRMRRLQDNLVSFWSGPEVVEDQDVLERLDQGRRSKQEGRTDPKGRYVLEMSGKPSPGVKLLDRQTGERLVWAEQALVKVAAWSPQGEYLALLVDGENPGELWILDRWGQVVAELVCPYGEATAFSWDSEGRMLALDVIGAAGSRVVVVYLDTGSWVEVGRGLEAQGSLWLDDGLYFLSSGKWFKTQPPQVQAVQLAEPVPVVLQRKRTIAPTFVREGNTFRLTRPALTPP